MYLWFVVEVWEPCCKGSLLKARVLPTALLLSSSTRAISSVEQHSEQDVLESGSQRTRSVPSLGPGQPVSVCPSGARGLWGVLVEVCLQT